MTRVQIRTDLTDDDGFKVDIGETGPGKPWYDLPLPPCPDCGGDVVWYEAGFAPAARKCMGKPTSDKPTYAMDGGCGSMYTVETPGDGRAYLRRLPMYS